MESSNDTRLNMTEISGQTLQLTIAQRAPLALFCFIMALFGILGNGTVLYSSIRYDAIRLDSVSLLLVQNLALADIFYTVSVIVPQFITYSVGKWVLGKVYCFIAAQLGFIPGGANSLIVFLISSYRLWLVTHPLYTIPKSRMRIILAVTWVLSSTGAVISLAYKSPSTFNPVNGKCTSGIYVNPSAQAIINIALGVIILIPLFAIIIMNFVLFTIAVKSPRRSQKKGNYKAMMMVCGLSGLFIISWVPYIPYIIMKRKNGNISATLDVLALNCVFLNAFGNPILYTLTNRRFGRYVKSQLCKVFSGRREGRMCRALSRISQASSSDTPAVTKASSSGQV
jgi:hypothetical protein